MVMVMVVNESDDDDDDVAAVLVVVVVVVVEARKGSLYSSQWIMMIEVTQTLTTAIQRCSTIRVLDSWSQW